MLSLCAALMSIMSCKETAEIGGCRFVVELEEYDLVWADEFDGDAVDESKWSFQIGDGCDINLCGWGNNELQWYTDRPENARVEDGNLIITAIKESPFYQGKYQYTSARMRTINKGDWKYGRMDVRAKIPIGDGMWPAIWMLPTDNVYGIWPKSGEIDIMENIGSKPQEVLGTIHYGHDFHRFNSNYVELEEGGRFADDFHVYSVIWNESCIQFMLDGEFYGQAESPSTTLPTTWPFDQDFHMILNIAVGGNLPGPPSAFTPFPKLWKSIMYASIKKKINKTIPIQNTSV